MRHGSGSEFNLHASQATRPGDRVGLERLCRYVSRPPLASERFEERPDGLIFLRFRRPWKDGTEGILFEPVDFLAKLTALVPPPRMHLLRFHGVFAPGAHLCQDQRILRPGGVTPVTCSDEYLPVDAQGLRTATVYPPPNIRSDR